MSRSDEGGQYTGHANWAPPPSNDEIRYLQRIYDLHRLLNGEWIWDVFISLHPGPLQYTGLLTAIRERSLENGWPGRNHVYLQDSTLNRTLRRLEEAELVDRSREDVFPYRVTYRLTHPAQQLLTAAVPLIDWADEHWRLLERARQRRSRGGAGG
jgi:DNA-binding HxlR family transcriptional regulator